MATSSDDAAAVTVSEGLQLRVNGSTATGYVGVHVAGKKYCARHKTVYLGIFDTAVEAAVAFTRRAEVAKVLDDLICQVAPARSPAAPARKSEHKMTAAEVQAACVAEGLTLRTSNKTDSGYVGVQAYRRKFAARHRWDYLGSFDTALEAALVYARRVEVVEVLDDLVRHG